MKHIVLISLLALAVTGCTENARSKSLGGTSVIELPKGQKLVNATWKESHIWYLTRAVKPGESPEIFTFQEKSSFGLLEGKVIFKEN